jgi:hypothetical protein
VWLPERLKSGRYHTGIAHTPGEPAVLMTPVRWCARKEAIRFLCSSGERGHITSLPLGLIGWKFTYPIFNR